MRLSFSGASGVSGVSYIKYVTCFPYLVMFVLFCNVFIFQIFAGIKWTTESLCVRELGGGEG